MFDNLSEEEHRE